MAMFCVPFQRQLVDEQEAARRDLCGWANVERRSSTLVAQPYCARWLPLRAGGCLPINSYLPGSLTGWWDGRLG